MGAAGGREAALCSCLLCCWNSALSANPFNSRPAVFVWVDEQAPDKWLDSVHAITPVSGLCVETIIQFTMANISADHLENSHPIQCALMLAVQNTQCTAFTCGML